MPRPHPALKIYCSKLKMKVNRYLCLKNGMEILEKFFVQDSKNYHKVNKSQWKILQWKKNLKEPCKTGSALKISSSCTFFEIDNFWAFICRLLSFIFIFRLISFDSKLTTFRESSFALFWEIPLQYYNRNLRMKKLQMIVIYWYT